MDFSRSTHTNLDVTQERRIDDYWNIQWIKRYIDVTRATNTSLDVMLERRIDDYWNVDGDRELSDM